MSDHIGTTKIETASGTREVPVWDPADLEEPGWLRVETPNGAGAVRLVDVSDAAITECRVETPNGLKAISTSLTSFTAVDGFEDGDVAEYVGDTGQFAAQTSTTYHGGYALQCDSSAGASYTIGSTTGLYDYPTQGDTFAWNAHLVNSGNPIQFAFFALQNETEPTTDSCYRVMLDARDDNLQLGRWDSGSFTELDSGSATWPLDQWIEIEVDWQTNGTIAVTAWTLDGSGSRDTQLGSLSPSDATYSSGGVGWGVNDGTPGTPTTVYVDHARIL